MLCNLALITFSTNLKVTDAQHNCHLVNSFLNLDNYILQIRQIHFTFWRQIQIACSTILKVTDAAHNCRLLILATIKSQRFTSQLKQSTTTDLF